MTGGLAVAPHCRVIAENDYQSSSAASAAIADEARRDDDLPLYVACGDPAAAAYCDNFPA